ncbi:hypothetical protein [Saccharospirillum alexandrii]|uniref:hypothetical protein n=1 Tax=Saccharospirillum alexandrii TaxID=2448477 RepID=UPI000FDA349A|nr:hypothetical protein [Saccharospirillum alexandrii]
MKDSLEMLKLQQLVENGQNVLLFGPETPKSQLTVKNYFRTLQSHGKKVTTVEISDSWNALEFSNRLSSAIIETFQSIPVHMHSRKDLRYQVILEDALSWANHQCMENECHLVIVLKEFHLLKDMFGGRVDAAFRTVIQRTRNISFVFMSSEKEALSRMFIHKSQPLYGMASSINIS